MFRKTIVKNKKMKTMKYRILSGRLLLLILSVVIIVGAVGTRFVFADQFDEQINRLRTENQEKSSKKDALQVEATSFEQKISELQQQISILQDQITKDQAKSEDLKNRIAESEKELERQRSLLAGNLRAMYLEGDMSTLEMLASSKDISEYVDKQQYRNSIKNKISTTMAQISALKRELKANRDMLEKTIAEAKNRQSILDSQRAEEARLLGMNTEQRNQLVSEINSNNAEISRLRAEQAAANRRLLGPDIRNVPDTSGYPWANAPFPNEIADPWGMYLRQCVSYTAWKVWKDGKFMPYWGGRGNANQWDDNALAEGIPVDNNPTRGSIGISNAGYYGHAVYVEADYGDGRILISQYNAGWDGAYSEAVVDKSRFVYIHF